MSKNYLSFLQQTAPTQDKNIHFYFYYQEKVWLKKATKSRPTWFFLPLKGIAQIFGLHLLVPVANVGGTKAIQCEIHRIQALAQVGVRVPEILAHTDDTLLLKDAANNEIEIDQLEAILNNTSDFQRRFTLYQKAVMEIARIHEKKSYLSEAFARNILVDSQHNFIFIDFETDPRSYFTLMECFARDWLCFMFSTARFFDENELSEVAIFLANQLKTSPEILQLICQVGQRIQWLLSLKIEKLGNDGRRLKKSLLLIKELSEFSI